MCFVNFMVIIKKQEIRWNYKILKCLINRIEGRKGGKKKQEQMEYKEVVGKMGNFNVIVLIIILNVNGLNILVRRQRVLDWIKK